MFSKEFKNSLIDISEFCENHQHISDPQGLVTDEQPITEKDISIHSDDFEMLPDVLADLKSGYYEIKVRRL